MNGLLGKPSMSFADKCKNVAFVLVIEAVYRFSMREFLGTLNGDVIDEIKTPELMFFIACVWAPLWEETLYRWVPITIANRINTKFNLDVLLPVVFIASALFGWTHGNGQFSMLAQGISGLLYCGLFIKNNNSIVSTIAAHSLWNAFVIFII